MIETYLFGFVCGVLVSILVYRQPQNSNAPETSLEALQSLREQMQYYSTRKIDQNGTAALLFRLIRTRTLTSV